MYFETGSKRYKFAITLRTHQHTNLQIVKSHVGRHLLPVMTFYSEYRTRVLYKKYCPTDLWSQRGKGRRGRESGRGQRGQSGREGSRRGSLPPTSLAAALPSPLLNTGHTPVNENLAVYNIIINFENPARRLSRMLLYKLVGKFHGWPLHNDISEIIIL